MELWSPIQEARQPDLDLGPGEERAETEVGAETKRQVCQRSRNSLVGGGGVHVFPYRCVQVIP